MKQLDDIESAARKRFKNQPLRVWVAMLGQKSWRAFVVNTDNKLTLATGPLRKSRRTAMTALKGKLSKQKSGGKQRQGLKTSS